MAVGFLVGLFGFLGHWLHAEYNLWVLAVMGGGAIWGSNRGARMTGLVEPNMLKRWIGWLLCLISAFMFFRAVGDWPG